MRSLFKKNPLTIILLIIGICILFHTASAKEYPYKKEYNYEPSVPCDVGDRLALNTVQTNQSYTYWCVPKDAYDSSTQGGVCREGFDKKIVGQGGNFWCLPKNPELGNVVGAKCPKGSEAIFDKDNFLYCTRPITSANPCSELSKAYDKEGVLIGCKVAAESISYESKEGKITYKAYQSTYEIPCQEFAGGSCNSSGLGGYVARIYQFSLMIVGAVAFAYVVYGGFQYVLSAGDVVSQQTAKDNIKNALWGMILLLCAYLILYTINPALVGLKEPKLILPHLDTGNSAASAPGEGETGGNDGLNTGNNIGNLGTPDEIPGCKLYANTNISIGTNIPGIPNGEMKNATCIKCADGYKKTSATKCECAAAGYLPDAAGKCTIPEGPVQNPNTISGPQTKSQ